MGSAVPETSPLEEAHRALSAAQGILLVEGASPREAARYLERARALAEQAGLSPLPPPPPEADAAALAAHARALAVGIERARATPQVRGSRRRRRLRRVGAFLAWTSPIWAYALLTPFSWREGPWRSEFFPTKSFEGESKVRRHSDIVFKWKKAAPFKSFPEDGFSARFDTCLVLDEPAEPVFRLSSDDGSRLFVDGLLVVDNWGSHSVRVRSQSIALDPGVHHLRVEYFEHTGPAEIELDASFDGDRPRAIPARLLRYPGNEPDPEDPCRAVREDP